MCLAIIAFQQFDEWPLFLAANRDESYERPSSPPALEQLDHVTILAPRDLDARGTWLGVNSAGILAVITNRSDLPQAKTDATLSRGLVVRQVLLSETLDEALDAVSDERLSPALPYNLLVGTLDSLHIVEHFERAVRTRELEPGIHVVSNLGRMSDPVPQPARARELWLNAREDPWQRARTVLRDRDPNAPICRHGESRGTVSSSMVGIAPGGSVRFLHAGGAPDQAPYDPIHDGAVE